MSTTTLAGAELQFVLDAAEGGPALRATVRARRGRLVLELDQADAELLAARGLTLRVTQGGRELLHLGAAPSRRHLPRLRRTPLRPLPVVAAPAPAPTPLVPGPRHLALV